MRDSQIVRIYTREPDAECAAQATNDLVVSVGGVEVASVISVSFGEDGTIRNNEIVEATIRCFVRLGAG